MISCNVTGPATLSESPRPGGPGGPAGDGSIPLTSFRVMRRSSMAAIVVVPGLAPAAADVQGR